MMLDKIAVLENVMQEHRLNNLMVIAISQFQMS